ncbi:MAG: hypothetical protein V9G10_15045 [Candidatus Nanopelagicales bacterium]
MPVRLTRVLTGQSVQVVEHFRHRPVEVDADHVVVEVLVGDIGQEARRVAFKLFEEDALRA